MQLINCITLNGARRRMKRFLVYVLMKTGTGHNFELYITIKGNIDSETGFLFDVKKLSNLIREKVIKKLDHKNLNMDVDFLQGKMCSTEVLAMEIWKQLHVHLPMPVHLHCVKLYETPRIYVEYFGD
jgi:6-pyruvoyltetrahydropterin/6-carboxytetrahydropterin synthase